MRFRRANRRAARLRLAHADAEAHTDRFRGSRPSAIAHAGAEAGPCANAHADAEAHAVRHRPMRTATLRSPQAVEAGPIAFAGPSAFAIAHEDVEAGPYVSAGPPVSANARADVEAGPLASAGSQRLRHRPCGH